MTCETNKMDFYKAMVFASWEISPDTPICLRAVPQTRAEYQHE